MNLTELFNQALSAELKRRREHGYEPSRHDPEVLEVALQAVYKKGYENGYNFAIGWDEIGWDE